MAKPKDNNTSMQYIYVSDKGLVQVTCEEADKILAPVLAKQAERKAAKEARLKHRQTQKQH